METKCIVERVPHYEVYTDKSGEWRWRLRAKNGRIIADGAEGYSEKRHVYRAVFAMAPAVLTARVVEKIS